MTGLVLLHALHLKTGKRPESPSVVKAEGVEAPVWLHFDVSQQDAEDRIKEAAPNLDDTIIHALCAEDTRPRIEDYDKEYLIILRGANLNPDAEAEDMVSLRIWTDGNHVISAQRRRVFAVQKLIDKLEAQDKPVKASEIIVSLTVNIIENLDAPIDHLMEEVDELEYTLAEVANLKQRHMLIELRQRVLALRRYLLPLRLAVTTLKDIAAGWLGTRAIRRLREAHDSLTRHLEDLDAARERLQFQQEELMAEISDRLNRNMYTLSIVAAIFLPLGFLTGLFGINVGGMPGTELPFAFWIVTGGCALIAIGQLIYFRVKGWF